MINDSYFNLHKLNILMPRVQIVRLIVFAFSLSYANSLSFSLALSTNLQILSV